MDGDTISYVSDPGAPPKDAGAPLLVLAMEASHPSVPAARFALTAIDQVDIGRGAERTHRRVREDGRGHLRITLPDAWMSTEHTRLVRDGGSWRLEDCSSKNGTFVRNARVDSTPLRHGDLIEAGSTLFLFRTSGGTIN